MSNWESRSIFECFDETNIVREIVQLTNLGHEDAVRAAADAMQFARSAFAVILRDRGIRFREGMELPELSALTMEAVASDSAYLHSPNGSVANMFGGLISTMQAAAELSDYYESNATSNVSSRVKSRNLALAVQAATMIVLYLYRVHRNK